MTTFIIVLLSLCFIGMIVAPILLKRKFNRQDRELEEYIFSSESRKYTKYYNNLDDLLEVKTAVAHLGVELGLRLVDSSGQPYFLVIDEQHYNWYIVQRHPYADIFLIAGVHKKYRKPTLLYYLGKDSEGVPFLTELYKVEGPDIVYNNRDRVEAVDYTSLVSKDTTVDLPERDYLGAYYD